MKSRWIVCAALAAVASATQADVQVNFIKPESFSDIRDNHGFRKPEVLDDLKVHLVAEFQKRLPGKDVRIDVTDVDLAGEYEPFFWRGQGLRVLRSYTAPSIELSYEVRDSGKVVQQGQTRLRDMNYQDNFNSFDTGDPLRYEKRMLDRWIQRELSTAVAVAPTR